MPVDRILGGLLGPPQTYGGLLSAEDQKAMQQQAMLSLGANLLSAGGPSPQRVGFGQALGQSLLAAQQARRQHGNEMLEAMLLKTKLQKAGQPTQTNAQKDYEYAKANGFTGSFEEWKRVASSQPTTPAAIQQYEYWKSLPTQEEKDAYLTVQRNMQPYQMVDVAGGKGAFNRATAQLTPVTTAEQEAAGAGQIASAQAGGRATGEAVATAKLDLPRVETNANYAVDLLDKIKAHPGLNYGVGLWSKAPVVPGTPQADFVALTEQMQGRQFLEAFMSLKGGGQITEIEGTKAENAIARMQRAQSKQAFIDAATEFQGIIRKGVENARTKARGGAPTRRRYNPQTGKIE